MISRIVMQYVSELVRVTAPGGTIIITASCQRELSPDEKSLKPDEQELLEQLCKSLQLPEWCPASEYVNLFKSHNVQVSKKILNSNKKNILVNFRNC